jgi:hypothetical protein
MSISEIPKRVFLDTCVVNLILEFGENIHENVEIPESTSARQIADVEALRYIFMTGQRASWQLAISPTTYNEVMATLDTVRRRDLQSWFTEIWDYWESTHMTSELQNASHLLAFARKLAVLADRNDRRLMLEAICYGCDAFCTRDWSTILKYRTDLLDLPIRILTPNEWWLLIRPWANLWT